MNEQLILVNKNDVEIGYGEKMEVHIFEKLHRAFSLFIYNMYDCTILIHKRAEGKYHSGGLWTNACCSRQRRGEQLREAVIRRMKEELGIVFSNNELYFEKYNYNGDNLCELGKFTYYHKFQNCAEYEIGHVFCMVINTPFIELHINKSEMSEIKWITIDKLKKWLANNPDAFTVWFSRAFNIVLPYISK